VRQPNGPQPHGCPRFGAHLFLRLTRDARLERVQTGRPSKTALRVAIRRAAHQLADPPPVLDDPISVRLFRTGYARDLDRAMEKVARDFRAYMAARSRFVEDRLADAVAAGVTQYVVLGAGLDTFAYRNPFPSLRVFEVDFPATQDWKRDLLATAGIAIPESLTYVALDFEHQALAVGLEQAGFDARKPAYFGWLGVVPYLTMEAFMATLGDVARLPEGTAITFDFVFPPETLTPKRRAIFDRLAQRVSAAGEPFRLFFTPAELQRELHALGFRRIELTDTDRLNELYFQNRADGLKLSPVGVGMLATAWV
jgi:methyltransferase (TIGR00027 family)